VLKVRGSEEELLLKRIDTLMCRLKLVNNEFSILGRYSLIDIVSLLEAEEIRMEDWERHLENVRSGADSKQ